MITIEGELNFAVFQNYTIPELVMTMTAVADFMSRHPAFPPEKWPEDVPTPDKLRDECSKLTAAADAVQNRDLTKIEERDRWRAKVIQSGTFMGQFAVMRAATLGDPTILTNLGFPFKAKRTVTRVKPLPGQLLLRHGKERGTVSALTGKVGNAGGFELQVSQVDPPTEESFARAGIYKGPRMVVKGLESAKNAFFRVRIHNGEIVGPWSPVADIIVL